MATKNSVLESLKDKGYSFAEVKHIIGTITFVDGKHPSKFKIGDVYIAQCGTKRRPVCIVKVTDCVIYGIPVSTTEDCLNMCSFKSRFLGEGFFSGQLVSSSIEYVKENFAGVLDSPRDLKNAVKLLKEIVNKL